MQAVSDKHDNLRTYTNMLAWAGIACLLIGFLHNRVVANCGFLLIGVYFIIYMSKMKQVLHHPWMWTFIAIALLPLMSDIILEGASFLKYRGVMKLLLILFPFFIFSWRPNRKQIQIFNFVFIGLMLYSSIYSLTYYFSNYEQIIANYRVSKVMKVLAMGDHIRISWAVVIACLIAGCEYVKTKISWLKFLLVIYIVGQVAYLHVLTSKMGLMILYITALILIISAVTKKARRWTLLLLPMIVLLPYLSFKFIPSFEQRVRYMKYDYEFYSEGKYINGLSDAVRYYSIIGGLELIKQEPFKGHGFSKLQGKIDNWYGTNLPEMGKESYFLPSSEILVYWASGGLLGLIVFLAHMLVPLFVSKLRRNIWFIAFFIPAMISFGIETHLEGVLPLWLYGWFCAWFWWIAEGEPND